MMSRSFYADGDHIITVATDAPDAWAAAIQATESALRGQPVEVRWENRPDLAPGIDFPQEEKFIHGIGGGYG